MNGWKEDSKTAPFDKARRDAAPKASNLGATRREWLEGGLRNHCPEPSKHTISIYSVNCRVFTLFNV